MRLAHQRPADLVTRLICVAVWITSCAGPTEVAPTPTVATPPTSSPPAPPATATRPAPTDTPTPVPTQALPVRFQADYPRPTEPLGASADQDVIELARWGNGSLNQLALAPDGKTLAAATTAGLTLYDVPALRQRAAQPAPSSVQYVAFAPDGDRIYAAVDGFILIVQASDGALLDSIETGLTLTHGDRPFAFAPDGATWAVLSANSVSIRALSDGSLVRELPLAADPQARRAGVRYLPDGNLVVFSTGFNAVVRKLDATTGQITYATAAGNLTLWESADRYAAYLEAGDNPRLVVVDLVSGQTVGSAPQTESIYQLRFAPDARTVSAAAVDRICSWRLPEFTSLGCLATPQDYRSAPYSSAGALLVPSSDRLTLNLLDPETKAALGGFSGATGSNQRAFYRVLLADQGQVYVSTSNLRIELWDEASSALVGSLPAFRDQRDFRAVAVLHQDQNLLPVTLPHDLLLLGNLYQTALALDLNTGAETELGGGAFVNMLAVSADGGTGAYLSGRDLILVNGGQARTLVSLPAYSDFTNLALSPDGRTLAAAYRWKDQNNIHLWDTQRGTEIGQIAREGAWYENRVAALSFAPDGRTLAVAFEYSVDQGVQVYDVGQPSAPVTVFSADTQTVGFVRSLVYTPDGAHLVLGRQDGTLLFLSTTDYRTPGLQFATGIGPGALTFLDEGRVLAIAGQDNLAHLWGVRPESRVASADVTATPAPETAGFTPPAALAGTPYPLPGRALDTGSAAEWVALARWGAGETRGLAVAPDGRTAALSTSLGLTLYALPSLEPLRQIETGFPARRALFSPDGAFVAAEIVGFGEERIAVWETGTGAQVYGTEPLPQRFDSSAQQALPFDFAPDNRTLAFLTDTEIQFLDLEHRTIERQVGLQLGLRPNGLRFTHQGENLVLVGSGGSIPAGLSWIDVATGAYLPVTPIPDNPIVAFDPSGALTAVVFQGEGAVTVQVVLLDAGTGAATGAALPLKHPVTALAFAPDGARLASLTNDGELCLWDPSDGTQLACRTDAVPGALQRIRFTPDGTAVVVGNVERVLAWSTPDLAALPALPKSATYLQGFETLGDPDSVLVREQAGLTLLNLQPQRRMQHTARGDVLGLALAPDAGSVFVAGAWGIEQVQIDSGDVIWSAPDGAGALLLSTDGRRLAAARADGRVALYAVPDGREPRILEGLSRPATGLALLKADSVLIAWNADEARLWSTADGRALPAPQPAPRALVTVLDGDTIGLPGLWIGLDRELGTGIWAVDTGLQSGTNAVLKGTVTGVQAAAMQSDGIVLLDAGGLTKLDNDGRPAWTYPLALSATPTMVDSRASGVIAVAGADAVTLMSGAGVLLGRIPGAAAALALGVDGRDVAVARGREVGVWSSSLRSVGGYAYTLYASTPYSLSFAADLKMAQADLPARPGVIWSNGLANTALDPATGAVLGVLGAPGQRVLYSADLQTLVDFTGEGRLSVARRGTTTKLLDGGGTYVYDLALSADGARLAAVVGAGAKATLSIWETNSATPVATISESGVRFERVALSASGKLLAATTGVNGDVLLYDLSQPARPRRLTAIAQRGVTALAFSPDETRLALGDLRGFVTIVDAADPTRSFGNFRAHGSTIQALLYFPDDRILATAAQDGTVRLWGYGP